MWAVVGGMDRFWHVETFVESLINRGYDNKIDKTNAIMKIKRLKKIIQN